MESTHRNKISDYILIGNCRSAALVSKLGSIDWMCLPEFDSPSIFAAILDQQSGGFFSICPEEEFQSSQKYLPDTNVAATVFSNKEGKVRLLDAFTGIPDEEKSKSLFADHELLRILENVSGQMRMRMEFCPRAFYGKTAFKLKDNDKNGIQFTWKEHFCVLLSTLDGTSRGLVWRTWPL